MIRVLLFVLSIAVVGCGSSGGTCEGASAALCKRAAACAGDGKARIVIGGEDGGVAAGDITFASEHDCETVGQIGCSNPPPDAGKPIDYDACEPAAEDAKCADSPAGKGVVSPAVCSSQ